jgi:NitT/TauT family transport system ATP-binding protein
MSASVAIRDLSKTFPGARGPVHVLDRVSLDLAPNEFVSLVGTSGCGKSTLLAILAGLQEADEGAVLLDGEAIHGPGLDRGMVPQSYTLLPWLDARRNIEFALKEAGHGAAEARRVADEHLALVGLTRFAEAYPSQLSGGMKQRVAIARALSYRPKVLLMDEPFGALDALTRHQMQALLTRVWERHRLTVLFITHDVEEAVYLSDRVLVMSNAPGRIKTVVPVPLPRPRDPDLIASPEFIAIERAVLESIRAEARRLEPDAAT